MREEMENALVRHMNAEVELLRKHEGAGHGNWGVPSDEAAQGTLVAAGETEKNVNAENLLQGEIIIDANKEGQPDDDEGKKEMSLEEYDELVEEMRKALLTIKAEERNMEDSEELEFMQQLSNKKHFEYPFIELDKKKEIR